jgi:glycerate kinase
MQSSIKTRRKILLIFDKFKDTIEAPDICHILKRQIVKSLGHEKVVVEELPISDGGDGFVNCLAHQYRDDKSFERKTHKVLDPLLRQISAEYLINRSLNTAYIEVANTSGLSLL